MEKKWYAVYTKPRWEKKVAESLAKIEIENYCPLNKVEKRWSDRKKIVEEPLFTSYVFIKIDARQQSPVREVDGVLNLVYWLGKPAVIKDEEIEIIKRFLNAYKNVRLQKVRIDVNDKVKIIQGPFMEMQGEVVSVKRHTVKVNLPSLGYFLAAEIDKEGVVVLTD